MPLYVYPNVFASGSVPSEWEPLRTGTLKYPVRNPSVKQYLRSLVPDRWRKVIRQGNIGEVHYFEHSSGQVAGVKFLAR